MPHVRPLAVGALLALASAAAADENPPAVPPVPSRASELRRQWTPGIPPSEALRLPATITRDDSMQPVSLKEAIGLALENNPGIAARRLEPTRQDEGVLGAQAQFDPTLALDLNKAYSELPNENALAGTQVLRTDDRHGNARLFKMFRSGTIATFDFNNNQLSSNAAFNTLSPRYVPELNFSVVQPLLQNFGWDFSYLIVRVAEQTADAALYTYQAQLADFVGQVIAAYWTVVRARDTLRVQQESHTLALRTVAENEARVKVGLLAPVSVLEAQADAKSREEQVLIADNELAIARQNLAQLVFFRPQATFVPRTLDPIEEAAPEEVSPDPDATLAAALAERPEVHASAHGVQAQQLTEKIAGNALLPRLDLVGSYGLNGLAGDAPGQSLSQPVIRDTPIAGGNCTPFTIGTPQAPRTLFICNVRTTTPFEGPRGDAYNRLTSGDFYGYSVGLQFQMPLSNAQARSQYSQMRIARDQAELNHRELLSRVTLEARQTVSDVVTTRQRITTSRVARELAEENLRNQEKRHEVGMATTKDLLDFQTRVTSARAAEVAAKVDHAVAVARWRRAQGRLLTHYQIVLERPGRGSTPWWARF